MRIIKPSKLRLYAELNPKAERGLAAWLVFASRAEWQSITEVRKTYPHADAVTTESGRTLTVFNIAGNHFRLVVAIHYNTQRIYIRGFYTHPEYDRGNWKRSN